MRKPKLLAFLSSCLILSTVCLPMQTVQASNMDQYFSDDYNMEENPIFSDEGQEESENSSSEDDIAVISDESEDMPVYDGSAESDSNEILDDDYYIEDYHIDIDVAEDNTFHITETLTYNFVQAHHGMTREIPLDHTRYRNDGSKSTIHAKVTNVECSDEIAGESKDRNTYTIKVGNADNYIRGEKTYTLSYDYAMGRDPLKKADELYFNIIGTEWNCPINNISWTIHMPKDFDASTIGYSVGSSGDKGYDTSLLTYDVEDNTISGKYATYLDSNEGITIRATLPEGYFTYKINFLPYIILLITVLLTGILFWFTGKDDPVVEVVSFEPPEDYTPVDVAYVMEGSTDKYDFTAMLISLADQGYIRIDQTGHGKKASFYITKVRDYDGSDPVTGTYMDGMFKNGTTVSPKSLEKDHFYETVDESIMLEHNKMKQFGFFYNTTLPCVLYFIGIAVVSLMFGILADEIGTAIVIAVIGIFLSTIIAAGIKKTADSVSIGVISAFLIGGSFLVNFFVPHQIPAFLICTAAATIIGLFLNFNGKRTPDGNKVYGELLGFKNFIKKAEVDRLKMFVEEDPSYYYHVLPYAYVFHLNDEWIKNFEEMHLEIPEPSWYTGTHPFDTHEFCDSFDRSMSSASTDPSSSSDGSSGGGCSGGGSGGGGGGAW